MDPAKLTEQERTALLDVVQVKPDASGEVLIPDPWSDEEKAHFVAKGWRPFRRDERPVVSERVRPTDYANDVARGTVKHFPGLRNYSFHAIEIPVGSMLKGHNFAQLLPDTPAIICDGDLTLVECNLTNCRLDPRWKLVGCNTAQAWLVAEKFEDGSPRERRKYICSHPGELKGDEKPPANVITERDF